MDNMDMEPLLKSYIRYAMSFVPKERMAYATNNGKYDRIKIMVNSKGNIIEPSTYAITFELYNGDQRIIIGSLWLSGNLYFYYSTQAHGAFMIMCYINLHTCYYNAFEPRCRRYIHHSIIKGIPNYIDFASNNEQGFVSVPKGILKLPKNLGV